MHWNLGPFILLALLETATFATANAADSVNERVEPEGSEASEGSEGSEGSGASEASEGDDLEPLVRRFLTKLDAELRLSDTQETQVKTIFERHLQQLRPHVEYIRKQPNRLAKRRAATERKEALRAIRAETSDAMKAVLTEDQFERFLELREELRKQVAERMRQ